MNNDSSTNDKDWSKRAFQSEPLLLNIPEFSSEVGEQAAPDLANIFGFTVCNTHFLLEEGTMAELIAKPYCTPVPNTPSHFLGLANIRRNIVPYYSLHGLLGDLIPEVASYGLLIGRGSQSVMLMVDEKTYGIDSRFLADSQQDLSLPQELRNFVSHRFEYHGKVWGLLDAQGLFAFLSSTDLETVTP